MNFMKFTIFALLLIGLFSLFGLGPRAFFADIARRAFKMGAGKPVSLADRVREAKKKDGESGLSGMVRHAKPTLTLMGKSKTFGFLAELSIMGICAGVALACLLGNPFLVPVFGVSFFLFPFAYVFFLENGFRKKVAGELEVTLSVVTNAYIRTGDIVRAVRESLPNIKKPIYAVFARFVASCEMAGKSPRDALYEMRGRIGNRVFDEWVMQAILCQRNYEMIPMLITIVEKLSNERQVQADLKTLMYDPVKEFVMMVVLCISIIPLLFLIKRDWFNIFVFSTPGKVMMAIDILIILIGIYKCIRISRPVEYS
jgi:Flp pilus assembly protein TadB